MAEEELELWLWHYTDDFGKRRVTRYLLSADEAAQRLKDAERVEGSRQIVKPAGGHFSPWQKPS